MSVKLKLITEKSWLVIGDIEETKIGLLTELRNQYVLMVKDSKKHFTSKKEVNDYFNEDVFQKVEGAEEAIQKKDYFIRGYPVDFDNPHEVIFAGNSLPLFSKKESSEVYYCAGYYCLEFPKNWVLTFCPKLKTLLTYNYLGPFKTELEVKTNLTRLRKEKNAK